MIEETCLKIEQLEERWVVEREQRYARRNKIRYIDELLNEFEMLNLADEVEIPEDLYRRVSTVVITERHPMVDQVEGEIPIANWMEALYDIQDTLMIPVEDDID